MPSGTSTVPPFGTASMAAWIAAVSSPLSPARAPVVVTSMTAGFDGAAAQAAPDGGSVFAGAADAVVVDAVVAAVVAALLAAVVIAPAEDPLGPSRPAAAAPDAESAPGCALVMVGRVPSGRPGGRAGAVVGGVLGRGPLGWRSCIGPSCRSARSRERLAARSGVTPERVSERAPDRASEGVVASTVSTRSGSTHCERTETAPPTTPTASAALIH